MTNKEFFLRTLQHEKRAHLAVIKAALDCDMTHQPGEKARPMGSLVVQMATQWRSISDIVTKGADDYTHPAPMDDAGYAALPAAAEKNYDQMIADVTAVSDGEWENGEAVMKFPGGEWKAKKLDMAWDLLFDAIHHRGQLSTYIRACGGKVPSIYGPSADDQGQ